MKCRACDSEASPSWRSPAPRTNAGCEMIFDRRSESDQTAEPLPGNVDPHEVAVQQAGSHGATRRRPQVACSLGNVLEGFRRCPVPKPFRASVSVSAETRPAPYVKVMDH